MRRSIRGTYTILGVMALCFAATIGGTAAVRAWEGWRESRALLAQREAEWRRSIDQIQEAHMAKQGSASAPGNSGLPPNPPQGAPAHTAVMVGYFRDAAQAINAKAGEAVRRLDSGEARRSDSFRVARARELSAGVNDILKKLRVKAEPVALAAAAESAKRGVRQAHTQLRDIGLGAAIKGAGLDTRGEGFAVIDARAVELVARDTLARTMAAANQHGANAEAVFRTLSGAGPLAGRDSEVNAVVARGIITGDPRATQKSVRLLFAEDPDSIDAAAYRRLGAQLVEIGGWTGTLKDYAEIVALTRTREATVEARHETLLENDVDLVQITGNNTVNFCTRFLGLVCTIGDRASDKYPALSALPGGGPPFHPRCSKGTAAFVEDLASDRRRDMHAGAFIRYLRAREAGTLTEPMTARKTRAA